MQLSTWCHPRPTLGTQSLHLQCLQLCRAAYFHIRALRHIRASLIEDVSNSVAVSVIHSLFRLCLRCANSVVHGLTNVKGLKSVQISVARVVFKNNPNCLLVNSCLKFKIAGITYGASLLARLI